MPRESIMSPLGKLTELRIAWVCACALYLRPAPLVQAQAKRWLGWLPQPCNRRCLAGFTLAELLIALAVLGVVATFSIPKVLQNQQNEQRRAVFKETIAAFSTMIDTGLKTGELSRTEVVNTSNFIDYALSHMNALKICNTHSGNQGCWDIGTQGNYGAASQAGQAGMVLANGATICGMDDATGQGVIDIFVDWNGKSPPNTLGEDQLYVGYCVRNTTTCTVNLGGSGPKVGGAAAPMSGLDSAADDAANLALWEQIFQ
jgi:prepilin-type N-terminal cleavage/methylation domain-containing protein